MSTEHIHSRQDLTEIIEAARDEILRGQREGWPDCTVAASWSAYRSMIKRRDDLQNLFHLRLTEKGSDETFVGRPLTVDPALKDGAIRLNYASAGSKTFSPL